MTRNMFVFILIALIFVNAFCAYLADRKENRFSIPLVKVLAAADIALFYYAIALCSTETMVYQLSSALYFASIDWLVYFLWGYVQVFTRGIAGHDRLITKFNRIYIFVAVLDNLSLVLNTAFHHCFTQTAILNRQGGFLAWSYNYKIPYDIHLIICYMIVALIMVKMMVKIVRSPKGNRHNYVSLLITFAIIIAVDFVWIESGSPLDYSLILYAILAVEIYVFTFHIYPGSAEEQMQFAVSESVQCALICFNDEGKCFYTNDHARGIFGEGSDGFEKAENYRESWLRDQDNPTILRRNTTKSYRGVKHYYAEEYHLLRDEKSRVQGSYIKMQDRTVDIEQLREEEYLATHDTLTGLLNADAFFAEVEKNITEDPELPRYLICTNIDDFKLVNDLFGQEFGDHIIREQAAMLQRAKYEGTIHGRINAERLAMLIPKACFDPKMAAQNTRSIQHVADGVKYHVHLHLGVYEITDPSENPRDMYDKAMLAVESISGNYDKLLAFYDEEVMETIKHENAILARFDKAMSTGQFEMYLQPQVDASGKVLGAEALCRWNHPERGVVFPFEFVNVLEKSGFIYKLDQFMWEEAARKLAQWKEAGDEETYISVNVSTRDFYYLDLVETFTGLVKKYDIRPRNLRIEVTETFFLHDADANMKVLYDLKNHGFLIEIDDFGSGYASLGMLMFLNVDVVKADMGFLRKAEDVARGQLIFSSIIEMTNNLGIDVITEGAETREQVDFVHASGCSVIQGYYYSKPIPVKEFEEKFKGGILE